MIKAIGVDIAQNNRFVEIVNNPRKLERILSKKEMDIFNAINSDKRKIEYVASRFACKEALIKALNKEKLIIKMSDVSVLNDEENAPYFYIDFIVDGILHLSLSHEHDYSVAFVVYEKE